MDSLQHHRDGSLLSFNIPLSPSSHYTGGGTSFDALRDVPVVLPSHDGRDSTTTTTTNNNNSDDDHNDDNVDDDDNERLAVLKPGGIIQVQTAGDAVIHSGKVLHGGATVERGERIVLVGFVDVDTTTTKTSESSGRRRRRRLAMRDGVLGNACRDWGRWDVAGNRWRRQCAAMVVQEDCGGKEKEEEKEEKGVVAKGGWYLKHNGYFSAQRRRRRQASLSSSLSSNGGAGPELAEVKGYRGPCYDRGFVPAFSSVRRRGDAEYKRRKQLETEDILLRDALMVVAPPPPSDDGV